MARLQAPQICQRIAQLRIEFSGPRGKASFSKDLGLSASTYDYYEKARVPPADVLVRIAERTGADLYWLLTGKARAGAAPGAEDPLVQRVAKLLADSPESAGALMAFLEVLGGIVAFPAKATAPGADAGGQAFAGATGGERADGGKGGPTRGAAARVEVPAGAEAGDRAARRGAVEKEGWVPILGRSAAGVARFWGSDADAAGVTVLTDLVERRGRTSGASVRGAEAVDEGTGQETAVQVITLPAGANEAAAEFVCAPSVKARYGDAFALRIDGESMAPEIRHGDIVIVSPSAPAVEGRPAVVQLAGQIGVICKLYRRVGGQVHLIPINEQLAPEAFPASKVQWALAVLARVRL